MSQLVLTRQVGESIAIGSDIVVTVVEVRGGAVRLGIDAPREVVIERPEAKRKEARNADV